MNKEQLKKLAEETYEKGISELPDNLGNWDLRQWEIDVIFEALERVQKAAQEPTAKDLMEELYRLQAGTGNLFESTKTEKIPYRIPDDRDHHWETPEQMRERDELIERKLRYSEWVNQLSDKELAILNKPEDK